MVYNKNIYTRKGKTTATTSENARNFKISSNMILYMPVLYQTKIAS